MNEMNPILSILSGMRRELESLTKSVAQMNKTHAQYLKEEYITKTQAQAILQISVRTLDHLKSSGQLPYIKINGLFYFKTTDIEHLFQCNYVSTSTSTGNPSFFNSKNNVSTSE